MVHGCRRCGGALIDEGLRFPEPICLNCGAAVYVTVPLAWLPRTRDAKHYRDWTLYPLGEPHPQERLFREPRQDDASDWLGTGQHPCGRTYPKYIDWSEPNWDVD